MLTDNRNNIKITLRINSTGFLQYATLPAHCHNFLNPRYYPYENYKLAVDTPHFIAVIKHMIKLAHTIHRYPSTKLIHAANPRKNQRLGDHSITIY